MPSEEEPSLTEAVTTAIAHAVSGRPVPSTVQRVLDEHERLREPRADFMNRVIADVDTRGFRVRFNLDSYLHAGRDLDVAVSLEKPGRMVVSHVEDSNLSSDDDMQEQWEPPQQFRFDFAVGRLALERVVGDRLKEPTQALLQYAVDCAVKKLQRVVSPQGAQQ